MESDASATMNSSGSSVPSNDDLSNNTVSFKDTSEGNISEDEGFVSGNEGFEPPVEKGVVSETKAGEEGTELGGNSDVVSDGHSGGRENSSEDSEVIGGEEETEASDPVLSSKEEVVGDDVVEGNSDVVLDGDSAGEKENNEDSNDVGAESGDGKAEVSDSVQGSKGEAVGDAVVEGNSEVVLDNDSGDGKENGEEVGSHEANVIGVEADDGELEVLDDVVEGDKRDAVTEGAEGNHVSDGQEVEPDGSEFAESEETVVEKNNGYSEISRDVVEEENGGKGDEGEAAPDVSVKGEVESEPVDDKEDFVLPNGDHEVVANSDIVDKSGDIETEGTPKKAEVADEFSEDPANDTEIGVEEESKAVESAEEAIPTHSNEIIDEEDHVDVEPEADELLFEQVESGNEGDSLSAIDSSMKHSEGIDGQIVTDSEEDGDTDDERDGKELFDSSALAALLKAATGADTDGDTITITSQDGSRLFSVERPAGLGSSLRSLRPAGRLSRPGVFSSSTPSGAESEVAFSEEEKRKLEKLQQIRVKFLRLVHRLGISPEEPMAAQVLYRLGLLGGRQNSQFFSFDDAKRLASELEADNKNDLEFSVNILVLGKNGVGKSATINNLFGEEKAAISTFDAGTTCVKEICGSIDGVKVRVVDTPGLKTSIMEQGFNQRVLSSVKNFTKKNSTDVVLYVDRLNAQNRDLDDLPLIKTVTKALSSPIWRNAIVTLTHAASAPPDGPSGAPLSYDLFVSQRSHVVQQSIGRAVGDLRMMSPSLMNPVSLVENHPSCRRNREGQKILPNGQSWRPQLLLLCYSMKVLSEANSLARPQDPFDHRKLFGFRVRSPPLPYMLSSMLQSRPHPKLQSDQGGDIADSDVDLDDLLDNEQDEEDEYDQLPSFQPLTKDQLEMLSKDQKKAYFEEYDYRVKLLHKKQWKEELRRIKEMRKKGKDTSTDYGYPDDDADATGAAAPVAVPLPDMALPPTFDGDNPTYRYRFLEPSSQFQARPVLDTHGWDHDCGYDGVNFEHNLAIANSFPVAYTIQVTKDKKDFTISLDSAIAAKLGEVSAMANFDIQSMGKQLAYVVRAESKFKKIKKHKAGGGISVTFLGENVVPGFRIEDHITFGKQYALVGSAGVVKSQSETAYGANIELQRREIDYPIGQVQSTLSMSIIKWRGDLALGFNSVAQFAIGRNSKIVVRAGINNKRSGQITVRTSSSDHLSLALGAVIPVAISIYKKLWPSAGDKFSIY